MISMKSFFLYIVIYVYMWNYQIYAGKVKWSEATNVYEFDLLQNDGKVLNMNSYKDMVLIIFNVTINLKYNYDHSILMGLAKKYHGNGLRVIGFVYGQSNVKANLEEHYNGAEELINIDKMSESEIEVFNIKDEEANELWKYISNEKSSYNNGLMNKDTQSSGQQKLLKDKDTMSQHEQQLLKKKKNTLDCTLKLLMNDIQSSGQRKLSISSRNRIIIVDKNGKVFKRYKRLKNPKLFEDSILHLLEMGRYAKSLYELVVFKYKDKSVSMSDYKDNVLIISSLRSNKDEKFKILNDLAEKYTNSGLKILFFLCQYKETNSNINNKKSTNNKLYITFNNINEKYDLCDCNSTKTDLWTYMNMQINSIGYNEISKSNEIFIVDKNEKFIGTYDALNDHNSIEDVTQHLLEITKSAKDLYELNVCKYNEKFVSMRNYESNVLIILSLALGSTKDNKYTILNHLAATYTNRGLKVLVFLHPRDSNHDIIQNKINLVDLSQFDLFENNLAKETLWSYMNMKIEDPSKILNYDSTENKLWKYQQWKKTQDTDTKILKNNEIFIVDKNKGFIGKFDGVEDTCSIIDLILHLFEMGKYVENVYELVVIKYEGKLVFLKYYNCNVLLFFTLTRNNLGFKVDEQLLFLINLAKKYEKPGLRIFVFQYLDNSNDENTGGYKTINEISQIFDLIDDTFAKNELHDYLNMNSQRSVEEISESNDSFIVDAHQKSIERYDTFNNHNSIEDSIQHLLKIWKFTKNLYDLVVFKYKGNSVSMSQYKGHVLIISSLTLGSKKDKKYNSLINIGEKYKEGVVKILIFVSQSDSRNDNDQKKITLIEIRNFHLFENNFARNDLWNFMNIKINQTSDTNRVKIKNIPTKKLYTNFIINQNGEGIQGYNDSSFKNVEKILKTYLPTKEES